MPRAARLVLVEDDPSMLARLSAALGGDTAFDIVATFETGRAALQWLAAAETPPDVLLTDLGLPDVPGLAVIGYCTQRHPSTLVMVLTMYEDEAHVMRSLEAGAQGYLLKDAQGAQLTQSVRELLNGGSPISPVIARQVLARFRPRTVPSPSDAPADWAQLSPKELTVLTRIAQGFSYAEIASLERVARSTVATHVRSIYGKLAVHSKNEAVFEASRLGLIDLKM